MCVGEDFPSWTLPVRIPAADRVSPGPVSPGPRIGTQAPVCDESSAGPRNQPGNQPWPAFEPNSDRGLRRGVVVRVVCVTPIGYQLAT